MYLFWWHFAIFVFRVFVFARVSVFRIGKQIAICHLFSSQLFVLYLVFVFIGVLGPYVRKQKFS